MEWGGSWGLLVRRRLGRLGFGSGFLLVSVRLGMSCRAVRLTGMWQRSGTALTVLRSLLAGPAESLEHSAPLFQFLRPQCARLSHGALESQPRSPKHPIAPPAPE